MEKVLRKIWQRFLAKTHKNVETILDAIKDTDVVVICISCLISSLKNKTVL
jgi:hypothetical protein